MNVHWTATGWPEAGDASTRLSPVATPVVEVVLVPPEAEVTGKSVRLLWACRRLLNGRKRTERSMTLLKNIFIFIEFARFLLKDDCLFDSKPKANRRETP